MPSLEEIIKQRLAEATKQVTESTVDTDTQKSQETIEENKTVKDVKDSDISDSNTDADTKGVADEVDMKPTTKAKKKVVKENDTSVSSQVSALLEAEGLSDEFKVQAVTIFEAAVADRVISIQEEMQKEFEAQLAEAKEQLNNDIDEFLSEAVAQWQKDNEVAIVANFNTEVNESFMDGLRKLISEHNVEVPEGKEDAFAAALTEVEELKESVKARDDQFAQLQEQINALEGKAILEGFREKMTTVEFDRFVQLTESVKFADKEQYEKQLNIVLENFGSSKKSTPVKTVAPIVEEVTETIIPTQVIETKAPDSTMARYLTGLKQSR